MLSNYPSFCRRIPAFADDRDHDCSLLDYARLKIIQINNREQVIDMAKENKLQGNSLIYATLQKNAEETPFKLPMQGYYADTVSEELKRA